MGYIIKNGISYFGDNAVELTQAQYDALPSSKLTDGVDYYITDAQAGTPLATEIAMSTSDSTSVADKIDELDGKVAPFASIRNQHWSDLSVGANNIDTRDLTVTTPAKYGIVCGFAISDTSTSAVLQCYFTSKTNLHIRILNTGNYETIYGFSIFYI